MNNMTQTNHLPHTEIFVKRGSKTNRFLVEFNSFEDGDIHCTITNTTYIRGGDIIIKHYLYPNQNEQIMRLILLTEALKDMGARSINAFIPYLPYARQDKVHHDGEVAAARILCRTLRKSGINTLYNVDNHFMKGMQEEKVEGLVVKSILIQEYLMDYFIKTFGDTDYLVVGPDNGAAYLTNGITMQKQRANSYVRTTNNVIVNSVEVMKHSHLKINTNTVIVTDDMISTGSTMIMAVQNLQKREVSNIYAMASHGLFLNNSYETISVITNGLIFSDTIPREGAVPVVEVVFENIIKELVQTKLHTTGVKGV